MTKKKKDIKSMEVEFLKRAQDYAKHILERQPIPPELKLKNLESRKASIKAQLEFLENAKNKMKLRLKKIDEQKSQMANLLATVEKNMDEEKAKLKKEGKKKKATNR